MWERVCVCVCGVVCVCVSVAMSPAPAACFIACPSIGNRVGGGAVGAGFSGPVGLVGLGATLPGLGLVGVVSDSLATGVGPLEGRFPGAEDTSDAQVRGPWFRLRCAKSVGTRSGKHDCNQALRIVFCSYLSR